MHADAHGSSPACPTKRNDLVAAVQHLRGRSRRRSRAPPPVTTATLRVLMSPPRIRDQRQDPQRTARALPDLQRRGRRSPRRSAAAGRDWSGIAGRSALCRACSECAGIGRIEMVGLPGIGADRLGAEAVDVALLHQPFHHFGRGPGRSAAPSSRRLTYSRAGRFDQSVRSSTQWPRRDPAVSCLPGFDERNGQHEIGVGGGIPPSSR